MYDQLLMFDPSDNNLAQVAGNYLSAQSIPQGSVGTPNLGGPLVRDYGRTDNSLQILVNVTTSFTSAGAATLQIRIIQADDAGLTTNVETIREGRPLTAGTQGPPNQCQAGTIINMGSMPTISRAFFGLQYVIGTATTTAGTVRAGMRTSVPGNSKSLLAGA